MRTTEAVLRDTLDEDIPRVEDFYLKAPEKDREYLILHLEDHTDAVKAGFHFIVEADHQIIASTMINPPPEGDSFAEAGNTLVYKPFRGFGLQRVFLELRAAALAIAEPDIDMTTGVNPDNRQSYDNVSSSEEFSIWTNPPSSCYELCKENNAKQRKECKWRISSLAKGRSCCCDFFKLNKESQRRLVQKFIAKIERQPFLDLKNKEGAHLHLLLESKWGTENLHLRALQAFADDGNRLE